MEGRWNVLMVVQEECGDMQLKLQSHCEPKRSRTLYGCDIMRAFSWKDSGMIELCDWSRFLCLYGKGVVEAAYDVRKGRPVAELSEADMQSKL
jgi:hypothetical protein